MLIDLDGRMSLGLLSAYDSSSSSSSDEAEDLVKTEEKPNLTKASPLSNPFRVSAPLPRPSFMVEAEDFTKSKASSTSGSTSVFSNPFLAKEEKSKAVLEKHVSMTTRQEEQRTLDGKKVCWNFRKGRCRFGHKCTFAHDSDVKVSRSTEVASGSVSKTDKLWPGESKAISEDHGGREDGVIASAEDTQGFLKKKKRPGLSDGIVPSKKAMKFHNSVYNKD